MIRLVSIFLSTILFLSLGCSQSSNSNDKKQRLSKEKVIQIPFPIGFKKNSSEVYMGSKFSQLKNSWKKGLDKEESYLIIQGHYYSNEENKSRSRNLGISRASELKNILSKDLGPDRIVIDSKKITAVFTETWEDAYSISIKKGNINDLGYTETGEMFIINYAKGFNISAINDKISSRLSDIADQMKNENIGANIICHTDKTSNPKGDYTLGKKLADEVKAYLVSKGVKKEELRSSSMGSSQPTTGESNRRIQLIFSSN